MANLGWPNPTKPSRKTRFLVSYYHLSYRFDIIFFWVARMIMAGIELYGEDSKDLTDEQIAKRIPFMFIHGLIRDEGA